MGDGKVLEKMGERRKYVRRDATVERLSAIFLEDMVGSVKASTLACYRRNIQCHILPALGERVAAELTAEEVNDFIEQLQEDYSPKLVREVGGLLLRIVGMAGVGYGEDVTLPKVRQKAVEVFTEPELKQMGQVILRRPDRTGLGVLLTAYTGLRLGELCGLQWQDVDVGAGLLHIQRTVERIAQIGGGTCLTVQPPKTENSERWIPIPKEMLRMLKPETKQPDSYLLTGGEIVPDPRAMQYRYTQKKLVDAKLVQQLQDASARYKELLEQTTDANGEKVPTDQLLVPDEVQTEDTQPFDWSIVWISLGILAAAGVITFVIRWFIAMRRAKQKKET